MTKRTKRRARRGRAMKTLEAMELGTETRRQISGFVQLALAAILFLVIEERAGIAGNAALQVIVFFFGKASILLPLILVISGLFLLFRREGHIELRSAVGLSICLIAVLGFIHIQAPFEEIGSRRGELGGAIGFMVSFPLLAFTSAPVAYVFLSALFLIGLLITFEMGPVAIFRLLHRLMHPASDEDHPVSAERASSQQNGSTDVIERGMQKGEEEAACEKSVSKKAGKEAEQGVNIVRPAFVTEGLNKNQSKKTIATVMKEKAKIALHKPEESDDDIGMQDTHFADWEFPSLESLEEGKSEVMVDDATLKKQATLIEEKLKEFDVDVKVREAHPGPTVTQFALEPAEGIKLSRIANLKNDLALALAASSLRIEAPIPGKSLVGIEMPNVKRTTVHLREMLESPEFRQTESPLSLPYGRDVSGKAIVHDLAEMPHLLIAGATGSGKSVCMNAFLLSLLFQNAPHELKFILVDPKRVELSLYDGIPHLLTPVITDSDKALKALRWAVAEMGRRLARFSEQGVRNIQEFNEKQPEEKQIPRIVIVIDELADLMMRQYRRDTEMMITRIAQIARATGMHLIIATQRPSVDVITGIIKANIPSRIAFRTVSSIDSRTILDMIGAEDLLGKGDMLFTMAHTPMPVRVQGVLVKSKEVERVISQVKIAGGGAVTAQINMGSDRGSGFVRGSDSGSGSGSAGDEYGEGRTGLSGSSGLPAVARSAKVGSWTDDDNGTSQSRSAAPLIVTAEEGIDLDADDDGGDDLTFEAIELVRRTKKASASLLQRHLKVGYARAARILDILEEKGVVGPVDGAKPRKVYVE